MTELLNEAASPHSHLGALPPNPRNLRIAARMGCFGERVEPAPRPIPAAESALGLRSRIALSSAQVLLEWTTSTSPCNNFPLNGDNPLNFVSHSKGSLHVFGQTPLFFYLAHFYLLTIFAFVFFREPASLEGAYGMWVAALMVLYPVCAWYRTFKMNKPRDSLWRLF